MNSRYLNSHLPQVRTDNRRLLRSGIDELAARWQENSLLLYSAFLLFKRPVLGQACACASSSTSTLTIQPLRDCDHLQPPAAAFQNLLLNLKYHVRT